MTTALITHQDCMLHNMGDDHPESPSRISAIMTQLEQSGLLRQLEVYRAELATHEHLERVHTATYLEQLHVMVPKQGRVFVDPDTALMPHTLRAAYLSAGAAVQAVDLVMSGKHQSAFCAMRPPGHHAERSKAMGFSFFNNVAVGVRHAMEQYGVQRVAIIDFDVHQGNGTVDIFQDDPNVMICSSFQHPFYPYSHYFIQKPNVINSPIDANTSGLEYRCIVEKDWLKPLQEHKPEIIFISAGFDGHKDDPMAELNLVEADYRWVTEMVMSVAREHAQGRVVSCLEGGYNLKALACSVQAHLEAMIAG